jgi:hypothetical protein
MIDARFLPPSPVTTPEGQDVNLDLGNGVEVGFGLVNQPGETRLRLSGGSDLFNPEDRGQPHVTYDVSTTADADPSQGIYVTINYREGDFGDESNLRIFHWENGDWQDRTDRLDTQGNRIRAKVESLSPFVLATGEPAPPPTIYLPLIFR